MINGYPICKNRLERYEFFHVLQPPEIAVDSGRYEEVVVTSNIQEQS